MSTKSFICLICGTVVSLDVSLDGVEVHIINCGNCENGKMSDMEDGA